jgi:1-acyl-sn-glycerol-3-phosphate acyltransferase
VRLVILDRDGVINRESDAFIKSPAEWIPLPGSLEAIARLTRAGYTVVVASNQSGVGRGLFSLDMLGKINAHMNTAVEKAGGKIDAVFVCPHKPEDGCDCRKPKPGLFSQIAARYGLSLKDVPAIGDAARDIDAARAVGARPILVKTGRGATQPKLPRGDVETYADLAAAAEQLVREAGSPAVMLFLRSLLFNAFYVTSALIFSIPVALLAPFKRHAGYVIAVAWVHLNYWALKHICRIDWQVEGRENIPAQPCIAYWKHQSAWETLAQLVIFPTQSWVLKRELMWIPLIGQALLAFEPIAINRKSGHTAVNQVLSAGAKRILEENMWVMIFPEGTRMPPGTTRRYGLSGALLADRVGRPIVPVAHNAGDFWKRNAFLKYPGTIRVRIGKPVLANGRRPEEVNAELQNWIEAQMKEISPGYQGIFLRKGARAAAKH